MEILVFKDNQIYRIDGIDPEFGCVSLVEVQAFYDQENLCVQELNELSNVDTVPSGEFLSALGAALSQNAPKLTEHRDFWNSPLMLSENRRRYQSFRRLQNSQNGADLSQTISPHATVICTTKDCPLTCQRHTSRNKQNQLCQLIVFDQWLPVDGECAGYIPLSAD